MLKKIISLICCLLPVGAGAAVKSFGATEWDPNLDPGVFDATSPVWSNAVRDGDTVRINSGNAINDVLVNATDFGVVFANGLYAGQNVVSDDALAQQSKALYIMNGANTDSAFSIYTIRDVSVGTVLEVLNSWDLQIIGRPDANNVLHGQLLVGTVGAPATVSVASGATLGAENLQNVNVIGAVNVDGTMNLSAETMSLETVNSGGVLTLESTAGDVTVKNLVAQSGASSTVVKSAANVVISGDVQNGQNANTMKISANGNVKISRSLENKGKFTQVTAENITVDRGIKNDGASSEMVLVADSLTVSNSESDSVSLFNRGKFSATVSGLTSLANGFATENIADAGTSFLLNTGSIDLGTQTELLNSLDSFTLNVTGENQDFAINKIENNRGAMNFGINDQMSVAKMSALGGSLRVDANTFVASGEGGVSVDIADGASATVVAGNLLQLNTALYNSGNTTLRSNKIQLQSVSNSGAGATVSVGSLTDETGVVAVSGGVNNANGNVTLHAKSIDVDGVITNTNAGSVNLIGSDDGESAISIGGIAVNGGKVTIDALANNVSVDNNVVINDGVLQLENSVKQMSVGGGVTIYDTLNSMASAFTLSAKEIDLYGSFSLGKDALTGAEKNIQWASDDVYVRDNVILTDNARFIVGAENASADSVFNIDGNISVAESALLGIYSDKTTATAIDVVGLLRAHGASLVANGGDIKITGNVRHDDKTTVLPGLSIIDTDSFELNTVSNGISGGDIIVGGINTVTDKMLTLNSANDVVVNADVINSGILDVVATGNHTVSVMENDAMPLVVTNSGQYTANAQSIKFDNVANNASGSMFLYTGRGVEFVNLTNSGVLNIMNIDGVSKAGVVDVADTIKNSGGNANILANTLNAKNINVTDGTLKLAVTNVDVDDIYVVKNMGQGADVVNLDLIDTVNLETDNLYVGGNFYAESGDVLYQINKDLTIGGEIAVAAGASSQFDVDGKFTVGDIFNSGDLDINIKQAINLTGVLSNDAGKMTMNSNGLLFGANSVSVTGGNVSVDAENINIVDSFDVSGIVSQNDASAMFNMAGDEHIINAGSISFGGIEQTGKMTINSSDVTVRGDVVASNLQLSASPETNWMNVSIAGDVSGGVDFIGLEKMQIGGNYIFDNNSLLHAAILPYANGLNSTDINYWANVDLNEDGGIGKITNAPDAKPLIAVGGAFSSNLSDDSLGDKNTEYLENAQIGIKVFDMIDQGSAIWLLHAGDGVYDVSAQLQNINVKFCNEDGTTCVAYFNNLDASGGDGLPAFISVRDSDGDGVADSLYVVFDERFGGAATIFPIKPIVEKRPGSTSGETDAAGALDELVEGLLHKNKFYNETPLDVLPEVFTGTHLELAGKELYNRMEDYLMDYDGKELARFSQLFANSDAEQVAGMMALNEHTAFRSFEDIMLDEFIWNRNRRLNKAWLDVDYGLFTQKTTDGEHTDGNRVNIFAGIDWQASETLIWGLAGRASHNKSSLNQAIDLSYGTVSQMGFVKSDVTDTNVSLGGYLMKILGEKYRLYGNAFVDAHIFDIQREQTFVDKIDGKTSAFSLISEWGLLHDILNQYIVGNAYARFGYNFGFDIDENISGDEYMTTKSDGYFMLTPGYSLTAQKRIYTSSWFQIRPFASIGVEYDVFGVTDKVQYKFADATDYVDYHIDVNPFWANIGGGFEMLSATGFQFGLDYRYQYNQDIQLHNIKVSGKYRF